MRDEFEADIPESLNALADRLRGWQPSAGNLDRDRVIFEAGREAGLAEARAIYRRRFWPTSAVAASLLILSIGLLASRSPDQKRPENRIELAKAPEMDRPIVDDTPIVPVDPNSYLALARQIADGNFEQGRTEPTRPGVDYPSPIDRPHPLRARDLDRLLNL